MILDHNSLKKYHTFGIEVTARYFAQISSTDEAIQTIKEAKRLDVPVLVLGGGSNMLFTRDFDGMIIKPELRGIDVIDQKADRITVAAGSGVIWDDFVVWCVSRGWGGLENLSHIPGTVGAAPVQNIGAYGAEAKDAVVLVEGIYLDTLESFVFSGTDCSFGYRNSIFKTLLKGRTLITKVFFELQKGNDRSIRSTRQEIIHIRNQKLPDPAKLGNAGSFFKNPMVEMSMALHIQTEFANMPLYPGEREGYAKLSAAFLIDQAGWKGVRRGNAGVHGNQPLVLVAYEGATGQEVVDLSEEIQRSVHEKFGVALEREVNIF